MFTGLVKEIGKVKSVVPNKEGSILTISCENLICDIDIDDSVSVNGACQTVTSFTKTDFTVQAVGTTLSKTTLGKLKVGEEVNLELALRMSDRLGGHLVQGHVNGLGTVNKIKAIGDNYIMSLIVEENLMKYIVKEGSITLNGVSLTISDVESGSKISVSVIPHTWFHTTFKNLGIGDYVNVEVDIIAKYVENFFRPQENLNKNVKNSVITEQWLKEQGY